MAVKDKQVFTKREFLSEEQGNMSTMGSYVELSEYDDGDQSVDAWLSLSDCHRTVEFAFSAYSAEAVDEMKVKIDRILDHVIAFRAALLKTYAVANLPEREKIGLAKLEDVL